MSAEEEKGKFPTTEQTKNVILANLAAAYDEESEDSESDSSSGSYSSSGSSSSTSSSSSDVEEIRPEQTEQNETVIVALEKEDIDMVIPKEPECVSAPKDVETSHVSPKQGEIRHEKETKEEAISEKQVTQLPETVDTQGYRSRRSSTSSSSSYCSEVSVEISSDETDSEVEEGKDKEVRSGGPIPIRKKKYQSFKEVMGLGDLEPIVDLQISVPENKVEPIGKIASIIGCIVTVESFENKPALDLSTVLFMDEGRKALGHIFEIFGRTKQPFYCVRFNSEEHVKERGIEVGMTVYAAPGTEHTRYVFLAQLERLRATDASWKDDAEVPDEFADYSDDEMEQIIKKKNRKPRPARAQPVNRSFPPPQQCEPPSGNRFARKRNFGYQPGMNGPTGPPSGPPIYGMNHNNFFAYQQGGPGLLDGPPRFHGQMNQQCRPMGEHRFHQPQHNVYGNGFGHQQSLYGPPPGYAGQPMPPNPFSVGGAAVTYRPQFNSNYPSQGYYGYNNFNQGYHPQQQQFPNNYWCPTPPLNYDQQPTWPSYQYQFNMSNFAGTPPPTPPGPSVSTVAPSLYSSGPVMSTASPAHYSSSPATSVPSSGPRLEAAASAAYPAGPVRGTAPSISVTAAPVVYSAAPTMYAASKVVYSADPVKATPVGVSKS